MSKPFSKMTGMLGWKQLLCMVGKHHWVKGRPTKRCQVKFCKRCPATQVIIYAVLESEIKPEGLI